MEASALLTVAAVSVVIVAAVFVLARYVIGSSLSAMVKNSILLLVGSVVAMIWGFQYRGNHPFAGVGAMFGAEDVTYSLAGWAAGLGVLAFLVGLALLIAGLVRGNRGGEPSAN